MLRAHFEPAAVKYVVCVSGEKAGLKDTPGVIPGRVTDYIAGELPRRTYDFYLCGRGEMIRDVTHLIDDRFAGSKVYTEVFF